MNLNLEPFIRDLVNSSFRDEIKDLKQSLTQLDNEIETLRNQIKEYTKMINTTLNQEKYEGKISRLRSLNDILNLQTSSLQSLSNERKQIYDRLVDIKKFVTQRVLDLYKQGLLDINEGMTQNEELQKQILIKQIDKFQRTNKDVQNEQLIQIIEIINSISLDDFKEEGQKGLDYEGS